jgi:cytochrome c553
MREERTRSHRPVVFLALALLSTSMGITASRAQDSLARPIWSELTPDAVQLKAPGGARRQVPGSHLSLTPEQIEDGANPPDWFPADHPPAPGIVAHGAPPDVPGCALCHLYSGQGHPESANLAGQPVGYLIRQMADFKSGARLDPARMTAIGKATADDDAKSAAQWFASLKPTVWFKVVESGQVPRTWITTDHLRLRRPGGGLEPLGKRIVEFAADSQLALDRDPRSGFMTYVPPGSVVEGRRLAWGGVDGRSIACNTCHGSRLEGMGDIPRIAGLSAVYVAHQLAGFRGTARTGPGADPMRALAQRLTQEDILYLAAYLVSLKPQ